MNFKKALVALIGLITWLIFFQNPINAMEIKGEYRFSDFEKAEKAAHLTWIVESTKVGLFSSDVYGYVLKYNYSGDYDKEKKTLTNLTLSFPIEAMNSDSEARDEKLHTLCMGRPTYDTIKIVIPGPISLNESREHFYQGKAFIRGKEKPFGLKALAKISGGMLTFKGKSNWSLQKMEIPDPSIAVAKLSDSIRIRFDIPHKLEE